MSRPARTRWLLLAISALVSSAAGAQTADRFFDASVLHDVRLYIHTADWQQLQAHAFDHVYYPADLVWEGVRVRNVGIRPRGGYGSRDARKPGLRVDMNRYVSGQRFLGLTAFVLDNALQDDSLVKERVAMRMFERLGVPAPREAHARLFVNNQFFGVYVIVEEIDARFLERRALASTTPGAGLPYIYEYQWQFEYGFEHLGDDLQAYAAFFEPKTHELEPADDLYRPFAELTRAIAEATDEDFDQSVSTYVDLDGFVRQAAIENFLADWDGLLGNWSLNNFYVFRLARSSPIRLLPWDKDTTFISADLPILHNVDRNILMRRAMRVARLRDLYLDTLLAAARLAATVEAPDSRGWLEREVAAAAAQIAGTIGRDRVKPQTDEAFAIEVERMLAFARLRSPFVECEVAAARDASAGSCTALVGRSVR
jgi:spore coat protein CotH